MVATIEESTLAAHYKTKRRGKVILKYTVTEGSNAGKMWVKFDDGKTELRWIGAFIAVDADRDDVKLPPYEASDDLIMPPWTTAYNFC